MPREDRTLAETFTTNGSTIELWAPSFPGAPGRIRTDNHLLGIDLAPVIPEIAHRPVNVLVADMAHSGKPSAFQKLPEPTPSEITEFFMGLSVCLVSY